ncbi:YrhB domain-containing protein [Streptomyces avicenniae]|uniref:YrhB domain-containing protein n=1 Tax=Streptomyces avicenniae TaxID=500153 RepID=UPI000699EEA6|nr:YrhB domain-containing protein [Streptomyces avicenniae]
MISFEEALRNAAEFLRDAYRDMDYTFVMLPELSHEYRTLWTVAFDTQEHLDTGDPFKAPMTLVLVVPKDGSTPSFPPSARPLSDYVTQLEGGQ